MNDAQSNLIRTSAVVRRNVESSLSVLSANSSAQRATAALQKVLKAPVTETAGTIQTALNLIGQLAPSLFGGKRQTPEQAGGQLIETEPSTRRVQRDQPDTWNGMRLIGNNRVEIRTGSYVGVFKTDDPEITGEMIPCTSSNVHSFGFQMNLKNPEKSMLLVRYLQGPVGGKSKGPLYGYAGVHPKLFMQMTIANSKGIFVWDELRIRGTIAGSQYRYTLLGIVGDNVPRRAILVNGIQILKQRHKLTADKTRRVHSKLQTQVVGRYRPTSNRPNRGNPDRGNPRRR